MLTQSKPGRKERRLLGDTTVHYTRKKIQFCSGQYFCRFRLAKVAILSKDVPFPFPVYYVEMFTLTNWYSSFLLCHERWNRDDGALYLKYSRTSSSVIEEKAFPGPSIYCIFKFVHAFGYNRFVWTKQFLFVLRLFYELNAAPDRYPDIQASGPKYLSQCLLYSVEAFQLKSAEWRYVNHVSVAVRLPNGSYEKPAQLKRFYWLSPGEYTKTLTCVQWKLRTNNQSKLVN